MVLYRVGLGEDAPLEFQELKVIDETPNTYIVEDFLGEEAFVLDKDILDTYAYEGVISKDKSRVFDIFILMLEKTKLAIEERQKMLSKLKMEVIKNGNK